MSVKINVANVDSPWSLSEHQCPDTYFTAGYGMAAASTRCGQWESVHWDDHIMLPYVLSDTGFGGIDAASPYGYSGIYVSRGCTAGDLRQFWALVQEYWRDIGVVAMFFRFSPLDEASRDAMNVLREVDLTRRGDTFTVSVDRGTDAVWSGMEGRSRTAIRKAENAGLAGRIRPARYSDMQPDSPFRQLYEKTMKRVESSAGYLFKDGYYESLLGGLGPGLMIADVHQPDGTTNAAALVLVHNDRVHYHLAGSTREATTSGANNLLLWTMLRWAADSGRTMVHLGGGLAPDDGLFRFKRSFGGRRTAFWTGAAVLNSKAYVSLVERRATNDGVLAEQLRRRGYFPAYRFGSNLV